LNKILLQINEIPFLSLKMVKIMLRKVTLPFCLVFFLLGNLSMIQPQEKNTKCKDELERICPGHKGDGKKVSECLKDKTKAASISPECKSKRVDFVKIKKDCSNEISSNCATPRNDGELYMCLRKNQTKLSTKCASSL
jgi:hypothetical protein